MYKHKRARRRNTRAASNVSCRCLDLMKNLAIVSIKFPNNRMEDLHYDV